MRTTVAKRLGATVIPMSGGQTEKQVQLIQDFKPTVILATPSYMLTIADEMIKQGIEAAPKQSARRRLRCRALDQRDARARSRSVWVSMPLISTDCRRSSARRVACECVETKDGPHIWEDHFYPEIINPETGEVLPDGEMGELVFTSLSKEALPIHSLPHARPDPPAARNGANACGAWKKSPGAATTC